MRLLTFPWQSKTGLFGLLYQINMRTVERTEQILVPPGRLRSRHFIIGEFLKRLASRLAATCFKKGGKQAKYEILDEQSPGRLTNSVRGTCDQNRGTFYVNK